MLGKAEKILKATEFDIRMTRRALELAAKGVGQVSPGPLVGCVVVSREGDTVGEGTYLYEGVTHAEVLALEEAGDAARGGTAYISLEPHSHHGKTPPCTDALLEAGISRVVAPIEDPNPLVSGKGFEKLRSEGVEVLTGALRKEAELQNEKFIHWHTKQRPFIHLKIAASLDGKCATRTGESKWITGLESRQAGQSLRHELDAILVGKNTVAKDDPKLTYRGENNKRLPLVRVVLDSNLETSPDSLLATSVGESPTLIFCSSAADSERGRVLTDLGVEVIGIDEGPRNLRAVIDELYSRDIQGLLVEGGPETTGSFLEQKLADKVTFFVAPIVIGGENALSAVGGNGAEKLGDALALERVAVKHLGSDLEITGYPSSTKERG